MSEVVKEKMKIDYSVISDDLMETLKDFYFVDFQLSDPRPRWVRQPYVYKDDLDDYLMEIKLGIRERWIRNVRIQQMSDLAEPMNDQYQSKHVCDHLGTEFIPSFQKIEMIFGSLYQVTQRSFDHRELFGTYL